MAAGYPVKVDYATGDVLTATNLNDLAGTVNFYDPTAKGDLFPATSGDAVERLAVGANDTVLTADSTAATGMKWAAAAASGLNYVLLNAGGTALTGATTITISSISGKSSIFVYVTGASSSNAGVSFRLRINGDTASNYLQQGSAAYTDASNFYTPSISSAQNGIIFGRLGNSSAANTLSGYALIQGTNASGIKPFNSNGVATGTGDARSLTNDGYYSGTSTVSSISIFSDNGNFDAGTIFVYGA